MEVRRWQTEPVEELSPSIGRQMVNTANLTVARILLAAGAVVPTHAHENEQVATVLEGRLHFVVGDEQVDAGPGESVVIPPNVPHEGPPVSRRR